MNMRSKRTGPGSNPGAASFVKKNFSPAPSRLLVQLQDRAVLPDKSQPVALFVGLHGAADHAVRVGDILFQIVHFVRHVGAAKMSPTACTSSIPLPTNPAWAGSCPEPP